MLKEIPATDLVAAMRERRAVRSYKPYPVDRATIKQLIEMAVQAPSAMNTQPWAFVVVEGAEDLTRCSAQAKHEMLRAGGPFVDRGRSILEDPAVNIFHGAPVLIVICATAPGEQAAEDCCLAAQNLMLAAHAARLATCPIGFSIPWLRMDSTKAQLGIPQKWSPVFALVLGHPDEKAADHGRRTPEILWR